MRIDVLGTALALLLMGGHVPEAPLPASERANLPGLSLTAVDSLVTAQFSWPAGSAVGRGLPPAGYDWEVAHGVTSTQVDAFGPESDSLFVLRGSTGADNRNASVSFVVPCFEGDLTDYHVKGRVRSTNPVWASPSGWTESRRIDIPCTDDTPGLPPSEMQVDTVTSGNPPDSAVLLLSDGSPLDSIRFVALRQTETVCGYTFREGERRPMSRANATIHVRGPALRLQEVEGEHLCTTVVAWENGPGSLDLVIYDSIPGMPWRDSLAIFGQEQNDG